MARLAFRTLTGNVLVPNTKKLQLSNDNKTIELNVVKYDLASDGIRLVIQNEDKKTIYNYLKEQNVYFKIISLGIYNTVINVTEFDYCKYIK